MKKLITMAMAVALAGAVQAAQITWGSSQQFILKADGSAVIAAGAGFVELIYVTGTANASGIYTTEHVVDSGLVGYGATKPLGGKYVSDVISYTYAVDTLGTGQPINNADLFIIRVWDAATPGAALNMWNSSIMPITAVNNTGNETLYLSSSTSSSGDWYPIPEPATASLLAIGMAAIALRRRFRK